MSDGYPRRDEIPPAVISAADQLLAELSQQGDRGVERLERLADKLVVAGNDGDAELISMLAAITKHVTDPGEAL